MRFNADIAALQPFLSHIVKNGVQVLCAIASMTLMVSHGRPGKPRGDKELRIANK